MYNVISPINSLGYGIAGLNICKELDKKSPVSLFPIGQPSVTNQQDYEVIADMVSNASLPDFNAPCIRIWHQHDMSQFVGRGAKVGFPIFELDNFTEVEKHHLSSVDKLFVCSSWAREVVLSRVSIGDENVHVIPLGVDTDVFKPSEPNQRDKTVFFNCGKWEVRKGHDILAEAFNRAFITSDDVELQMMCENPFNTDEEEKTWQDLYKQSVLGDKITILGRVDTHEEVYNIMSNVDCGVFPSRGEGWNLELLEMMACNKPVITTDYSAHTEFCNKDNAFLVEIDELEPAKDNKWFNGLVGSWASIQDSQIDQIAEFMAHVHKNKVTSNATGVETAKQYSWANSANIITGVFS